MYSQNVLCMFIYIKNVNNVAEYERRVWPCAPAAGARLVHAAAGAGGALRGPVPAARHLPAARALPAHRQGLQQHHRRR